MSQEMRHLDVFGLFCLEFPVEHPGSLVSMSRWGDFFRLVCEGNPAATHLHFVGPTPYVDTDQRVSDKIALEA